MAHLTSLIKQLAETALSAELDSHLANDIDANRKNGSSKKPSKHRLAAVELANPRDRNSKQQRPLEPTYPFV
ncbi:hypothetical protein ACUH6D_003799 [Yersinia enterocolitica]